MKKKFIDWLDKDHFDIEYSRTAKECREKKQEEIRDRRLNRVLFFMILGLIGFILHLIYLPTNFIQSYGAIIGLIGILGEITILQTQNIDYKSKKNIENENSRVKTDEFSKTKYFYLINILCYTYMILGTIIWAYWGIK